ncbi:exodeoxyribonuclease VII large subunit [Fluoribacter dumoffii]|uniref:exodeoxyribonuclease VII large subunit n=1 Tax=Fluoribacter dumoffii TaxID=463 RepID=UPI002244DC06|nr:exodeoxyribonuclease VII large subunit [Fluoribacter dumoffii]MCW8419111.1 exodeoxyribonuclease VII large subunit [Fluoribacter dumoffii]MCW8453045.1 exodeoxyribonuclease VII large subunit [Fluoribacter dumoffii]MCW8459737.1 exodeoxyribonuclease VII large subunit [Fluoribacter dumoffii]MCW8483094.1 exodeoxyribonuclease VII large subunit [Fluoribacter dumoffii]
MMEKPNILTVTQLNRQVKSYLENGLGIVYVEGELSNLSKPTSGHFYFTLKDHSAQIRCVYFKNRHLSTLTNKLGDGQHIVAKGRLSLYEARGDYQLIVEEITEAGLGALYQRFEELKNKLAAEGLFDTTRKRPIPVMPRVVGVITSTTGAAIRDILSTLARRFPLAKVLIYPSEVQGAGAAQQLIKALQHANKEKRCEVLLLARGGGSIEDLWAFNDEQLARHIAKSTIPVVSGVGHETDFTIADFVADYRAETPTAAATAVTPDCNDLFKLLNHSISRMHDAMQRFLQKYQVRLHHLTDKISSPQKAIASYWQTADYLERQLIAQMVAIMKQRTHQLHLCMNRLHAQNPKTQIRQTRILLEKITLQLIQLMQNKMNQLKYQLRTQLSTLHAVSPLATLDRGYAIAKKENKVLFSSQQVALGDSIEVVLAKGNLTCEITHINE